MSVSWMHAVHRLCAAAVIDCVIRHCGVVTWSARGLGGYFRLLVWGCSGGGVVLIGVVVWWVLICGVSEVVECIIEVQLYFSEV